MCECTASMLNRAALYRKAAVCADQLSLHHCRLGAFLYWKQCCIAVNVLCSAACSVCRAALHQKACFCGKQLSFVHQLGCRPAWRALLPECLVYVNSKNLLITAIIQDFCQLVLQIAALSVWAYALCLQQCCSARVSGH